VVEGAPTAGPGQRDVDDLLLLAMSRPHEALSRAREILAARPDPYAASVAHHAAGIVLRDVGDVEAGVSELRAALRLARRTDSQDREADVLAALGAALIYSGRTTDGLTALHRAVHLANGVLEGRVLHRRGMMLWHLGRYGAALDDFRRAVSVLQRSGDPVWTARALLGRGLVYLAIGSPARADADFVSAGRLYAETSQELEAIYTVVNRAWAAFRSGDLPTALSFHSEAAARFRLLNVPPTPFLTQDRCDVMLAAGLVTEALAEADTAVHDIERAHGWSTKKAELLLVAANCALAAAQPQGALDRAQAAYRLFKSQQNVWGQAHARLVLVQARYAVGSVSARLLRAADEAAGRLEELGSGEATQAHLLAGRVALDLGRRPEAERHLGAAARSRRRGPAMARASGWLAEALRAEAIAEPRRMLAACHRGLEVLDDHQLTLGASELRAQATARGGELALLAQRHAVRVRRPRLLLSWTERWRATALTVPSVRPSADAQLNTGLAALREVTSRLEGARRDGTPTGPLRREQLRLEGVVRARSLQAPGLAGTGRAMIDVGALLDQLGTTQLIEIVDVDGTLHVLVCGDGRVRHFTAGRTEGAVRAADFAPFALRRLARGRAGDDVASARAILDAVGPELQDAILGPAAAQLGDAPVVVVPPGKLHAVPWALLPALGSRVFSVAPSAQAWMRAHAARPPRSRRVTLARGPGLATDGAEVPLLAKIYPDAAVLSGDEATAKRVLSAIDGAWLAHIAAHGRFRADSPLFSSLRMRDGPLTVYDFEQLRRAPYRLVLSSCDSAVLAPAGADELLGLVSSLLPLGTVGIVAGVVPLNDDALVPLMVSLHRHLLAGQSLAESLYSVRLDAADDPVQRVAAISLVALGAG
jgi:tetratricopeptide (TPR) repeat protein